MQEYDLPATLDRARGEKSCCNPTKGISEPLQNAPCGEGIAHAGRKGAHRYLRELPDRILQILNSGWLPTEGTGTVEDPHSIVTTWRKFCDRQPHWDVITRPYFQAHLRLRSGGPIRKLIEIYRLKIIGTRSDDGTTGLEFQTSKIR